MPNPKSLNLNPPGARAASAQTAADKATKAYLAGVKLGERIRYYRTLRKLRQEDLVKRVGCTIVTLSRWENGVGTINMSLRNLLALAKELNVSTSMLMRGIDWK